mgnify:FL=1
MNDLIPFTVDGPVKFFKVLTFDEKKELLKRQMIQPKEVSQRILSFHKKKKQVIGYEIYND